MLSIRAIVWGGLAALIVAIPAASRADDFASAIRPLLSQKCAKCHGEKRVAGRVNFKKIATSAHLLAEPELIDRMISAVEANDMPPVSEPPLDPQARRRLLRTLKAMLKQAAAEREAKRPPVRRLNRFQYNNAVKDLFRLKTDVFPLPEKLMTRYDGYLHTGSGRMPDEVQVASDSLDPKPGLREVKTFPKDLRAAHGFDNQADQLTLSPLLLDAFLRLSVSIVESPDFTPQNVGIWDDFFKEPADASDVRSEIKQRLRLFMRLAFRGPVDHDTLERYTAYTESKVAGGLSFPEAMKKAASAVLSSPMFLLRVSAVDESEYPFELASDLSFFLWGSCPDAELLGLAESGELTRPAVLQTTIDRMLADPKIERFLDTFPTQWLQLENVLAATPDPRKDRYFALDKNYPASLHMVLEPLLLFDAVFIEDRPIQEFIAPSFTYQSDFLQAWYHSDLRPASVDVKTITPTNRPNAKRQVQQRFEDELRAKLRSRTFRRVPATDPRYGGVITNAAVLSMTSGPQRTHPIARGAWVIEVIFNDPPPPPPNDIPPLKEEDAAKNLTIRERFAVHRQHESCAGCHSRLDPLGFALENYDITGRWRDQYENGREVDASGTLMRKHHFEDPVRFKEALVNEDHRFAKAFTAHLLRFALARELGPADAITVDSIVKKCATNGFKLKSLIREVILSDRFLRLLPD